MLPRPVDPDVDHTVGPDDAPVSVVEYGDLGADFDTARTGALGELAAHVGADLQYTFRHAASPGTMGWDAALAAEAAARQGRFEPFRAALSNAATPIGERDIRLAAARAGVNIRVFDRDRATEEVAARVRRDSEDAGRVGVRRTPTLFIGGRLHDGPTDARSLIEAVERSAPRHLTADGRVAWSAASLEWTRSDVP
jgi:protein-disulfide isomerase